jgi:predicted thioesterase
MEDRSTSCARRRRRVLATPLFLGVVALAALLACGSEDDPGPAASSCTAGTRVDVLAAGATPGCLRVAPSTVVTLANGRAAAIAIRSAPHPTHGSCPELDATAQIPPGGTIEVTMVTVASCSFHDHETGTPLGVIQVVQPGTSPADPPPYVPPAPY